MFAEVSFPISSYKSFTYSIPIKLIHLIQPGTCVNAPIGNYSSTGFVVRVNKTTKFKGKIKNIYSIKQPEIQIPKDLMQIIVWTSQYYLCPIGMVLKAAIPIAYNDKYLVKNKKFINITDLGILKLKNWTNKRAIKQFSILTLLKDNINGMFLSDLSKKINNSYNPVNILNNNKLVTVLEKEVVPHRFLVNNKNYNHKTLSENQNLIYKEIAKTINKNTYSPFLIHGVPGSGKTEVYIKLAQKAINRGKKVLILVPEISLTPQLLNKFRNQFGNRIALWHSKVKSREKGWVWQKLYKNKFDIIIGARSAIFLPINNLGLIIIDEEHENSYKQNNPQPRYNARDIALVRSKILKTTIVLGSATPCMETYYNCLKGKIKKINLKERYGESVNPQIEIVDMLPFNQDVLISPILKLRIEKCLNSKEQVIIFHNRRGYAIIQKCRNCNSITRCNNCSVSLTYHKSNNKLICHHCQKIYALDGNCIKCNNKNYILLGAGTQKIEQYLQTLFPKAILLRMDSDKVKSEDDYIDLISKYENHKADILIGTQMVAKGLDFENVTLVGIINADVSLSSPDFRTGERIFQLLYQVCGRSGRHKKRGSAIIQTHNPKNSYIKMASELNIKKFYNTELSNRLELNYPPSTRIIKITIKGKDLSRVINTSEELKNKLIKNKLNVLGPIPAPLERIKLLWRYIIIIKDDNYFLTHTSLIKSINIYKLEKFNNKVKIQLDVDPVSLL